MGIRTVIAATVIAALTVPAVAQTSEMLFSHKNWSVSLVAWQDGTISCVAEVYTQTDALSIYVDPDGTVELEFFSKSWQFGEGEMADLQFEIDRRGPWSATARLVGSSALIELTNSQSGFDVIYEIARGNRMYLRDAGGGPVMDYSLAGSSASIQALLECGTVITDQSPGNPFS